MKRGILLKEFVTLGYYLSTLPRLKNNKSIALFLEKNSMRLLNMTYIVPDTNNILFDIDLYTVELVCRLTYSGLLKSIVQQANFVYKNRCSLKTLQYQPQHTTSILCLQQPCKIEDKDVIRQFLESQDWYTLWTVLGDDLFRHLLLNCIILFYYIHPDLPCNTRSVYIQLCGRLFTTKVQKYYLLLPRCEQKYKMIHTFCNLSYHNIASSHDPNPLLKRYYGQMQRCRKRKKKKIEKEHKNKKFYPGSSPRVTFFQRPIKRQAVFECLTRRRHLKLPEHFILNRLKSPECLSLYILKMSGLTVEPLFYTKTTFYLKKLMSMTQKILEKYSSFPLQKFFKRYCNTTKLRHGLKKHLKQLNKTQNSCKMGHDVEKWKNLLFLSTPALSVSKFVIACVSEFPEHAGDWQNNLEFPPLNNLSHHSNHKQRFSFDLNTYSFLTQSSLPLCYSKSSRYLIPEHIVGGHFNFFQLIKKVMLTVHLNRYDVLPCHSLLHCFKLSHFRHSNNLSKTEISTLPFILVSLIRFVLEDIVSVLVSSFFYITTIEASYHRPVFFVKIVWILLQRYYEEHFIETAQLQGVTNTELLKRTDLRVPYITWKAKTNDLRPRVNFSKPFSGSLLHDQLKECLNSFSFQIGQKKAFPFLKHGFKSINALVMPTQKALTLYFEKYPSKLGSSILSLSSLYKIWKQWKQNCFNNFRFCEGFKTLYVVVADLKGCFNCIPHCEVFKSLEEMNLPSVFTCKRVCLRASHEKRFQSTTFLSTCSSSEWWEEDCLKEIIEKSFKKKSWTCLIVCNYTETFTIRKENLMKTIQCHLNTFFMQTRCTSNQKKVYRQCMGLPQGSTLSPVLCAAFFARKDKQIPFHDEPNELFLRYVDDFLFITPTIQRAVDFLYLLLVEQRWGTNVNWLKVRVSHQDLLHLLNEKISTSCFYQNALLLSKHISQISVESHFSWASLTFSVSKSDPLLVHVNDPHLSYSFHRIQNTLTLCTFRMTSSRPFQALLHQRILGYLSLKLSCLIPYCLETTNPSQILKNYHDLARLVAQRLIVLVKRLKKQCHILISIRKIQILLQHICKRVSLYQSFRLASKKQLTQTNFYRHCFQTFQSSLYSTVQHCFLIFRPMNLKKTLTLVVPFKQQSP